MSGKQEIVGILPIRTLRPWLASATYRGLKDSLAGAPFAEFAFYGIDDQGTNRSMLAGGTAAEVVVELVRDVDGGADAHAIIMAQDYSARVKCR